MYSITKIFTQKLSNIHLFYDYEIFMHDPNGEGACARHTPFGSTNDYTKSINIVQIFKSV